MRVGVIGGGIAGLGVAHYLVGEPVDVEVHEASAAVGGLARSFVWHGFDCDLGAHRLAVEDRRLLDDLKRLVPLAKLRRRSRIYVHGRRLREPLSIPEMLIKFLPFQSFLIILTYLIRRKGRQSNFSELARGAYGSYLNKLFFEPYTEKLFGIPASKVSASWGRRKLRIGGRRRLGRPRLHFRHFYYPCVGGYGAISGALHARVSRCVELQSRLAEIEPVSGGQRYRCTFHQRQGIVRRDFDVVVSSVPISRFAALLGITTKLQFRTMRLVYVLVDRPRVTDNHWIYFADPSFVFNRVSEPRNFAGNACSRRHTVLCCEITDLAVHSTDRVIDDLKRARLVQTSQVIDTTTIDVPNAYPIQDIDFEHELAFLQDRLSAFPNIIQLGRSARFAYEDADEILIEAREVARQIASVSRKKVVR